jgi:hypothetical protein
MLKNCHKIMITKLKSLGSVLSSQEMKKVTGGGPPATCGTIGQLCNITYHNADCCPGYLCGPPFGQLGYEHIGLCTD